MTSLWTLLLSAQTSVGGVPQQFLEEKKAELRQKHAIDEQALGEARRRAENGQRLDDVRARERGERGNMGRGGGRGGGDGFEYQGRGGRGGRGRGGRDDFGQGGRGRDSGWGPRGGGGGRGGFRGGDNDRVGFLNYTPQLIEILTNHPIPATSTFTFSTSLSTFPIIFSSTIA